MTISRDEAERALAEIGEARGRIGRVHGYADMAPFLILWGAIWLVANTITDLLPEYSDVAWTAGTAVGVPVSALFGVLQTRRWRARAAQCGGWSLQTGRRIGLSWCAALAFFVSIAWIVGPLDGRQINAAISIFWAFVYMAAGIWIGWRLTLIGLVAAVAIMTAYLALDQHYSLAIGLIAGGSLILGGLWLRKI